MDDFLRTFGRQTTRREFSKTSLPSRRLTKSASTPDGNLDTKFMQKLNLNVVGLDATPESDQENSYTFDQKMVDFDLKDSQSQRLIPIPKYSSEVKQVKKISNSSDESEGEK